jgi:hypothetical protein
MPYASHLLTNFIQYIQCFCLVASSILCHTPIRTNTSNVDRPLTTYTSIPFLNHSTTIADFTPDPSVTHLTSFYAHTCITTVRSLHLQLANKPCPDQRFRTQRSGPPSITHIRSILQTALCFLKAIRTYSRLSRRKWTDSSSEKITHTCSLEDTSMRCYCSGSRAGFFFSTS